MKRILKWAIFLVFALIFTLTVGASDARPLPSLSVTVDDYVYGSERSTPRVEGNLESGRESYFVRPYSQLGNGEWREITQRPISLGMPTEGGRYELKVTVGQTANYDGGSAVCDFYVLPTDLDVKLNVKESIFFGDDCTEGGLFTLGDLLGRQYSVTFSKKGENLFTSALPSETGVYTVKVSVSASNNFNATEMTADFEIVKRAVSGELDLDDMTVIYGKDTVVPPVPTYIGKSDAVRAELERLSPIVEYRPLGSSGEFSATVPTEVGDYEVRVRYSESRYLHAASALATLRIVRSPITPTVTINGWVYGETPSEPRLSDGSNPGKGRVYYYYRPEGGEFSTAFPTDAGKYTLKVVIEAASGYAGGECFAEFTIEKAERSGARLVFGDSKYGERLPSPYVSGTLDGAPVTFSYSLRGKNEYSATPPTESGEYTLRAEISEGKNYKARVIELDFIIEKADVHASVYVENRVYGDKNWTVAVSGNEGGGEYLLSYYIRTGSGYAPVPTDQLSEGRPYLAGEYKVICEILESKNHKGCITEGQFVIARANPSVSVSMSDYTFYSKAPLPTVNGNREGGDVSFIYYTKGGDISGGSYDIGETVTRPGEYTVAAVVSQTRNYNTVTVTADFTVHKADLPISSISLSIKSGGGEVGSAVYGEDFELSLKNNVGYGAVSFSYQKDGGEFLPQKPTAVGSYRVKATVAATEIYKSLTVFFDLTIIKAERKDLELAATELVYGGEFCYPLVFGTTAEIGGSHKSYSFKPIGADDEEYSSDIPTLAGKYTVKLEISETESYLGATVYGELTIKKAPSVISLPSLSAVYSGQPVEINASLNHAESELVSSGEVLTDAGEYTLTFSVAESANYEGASLTVTFTVLPAEGEITDISMPDRVWNGSPTAAPTYSAKGDGEVTVEYYCDGQLLDGVPVEVGEYTVKLTLSDGKNFKGCSVEKKFKITAVPPIQAATENVGGNRTDGNGAKRLSLILIIIIIALLLIAALVWVIIRIMGKDNGSNPPTIGGELPPSDGEGRDALEAPAKQDAITDGSRETPPPDNDTKDSTEGKKDDDPPKERLTDRGEIALDMWLTAEDEDEVIYRKRGRYAEINIDTVCRHFEEGERVDLESLKAKGLINKTCKRVKLLGRGAMTKKLDIQLDEYSKGARDILEAFK